MGELSRKERVDTVEVPGQMSLPGSDAKHGSRILPNVKQEDFCWEYVRNGNNGRLAYKSVSPEVSDKAADEMASKWSRLDKVKGRIDSIRQELRKKWEITTDDIMEFHGRVLKTDRRKFFDAQGARIQTHLLPDDLAAIVDLDSSYSKDGGIMLLPAVASRAKSADAMARMMGLDKSKLELTGKDGGPIEESMTLNVYIPDNMRG